eukprot:scaffold2418_cov58-Cyclotella_meneghiniana.AAC.16
MSDVRIGASDRAVLVPAAKVVVGEDHEMQQMGLGGRAFLASIEAAAVRFVVTNAEIFVFGGGEHGLDGLLSIGGLLLAYELAEGLDLLDEGL